MRIENELKLDYSDVLIRPKRSTLSSRKNVSLERSYKMKNIDWSGVPIMAANMDGVGTFEMANILSGMKLFTCLKKTYSDAELIDFFKFENQYVAMSIGITKEDLNKFKNVYAAVGNNLRFLCIDVANGYTEHFVDFIKSIKNTYSDVTIIAGNVVTGDMTEQLILSGAEIVKIGIGPGSACTTRIQTGVGYPQLSAVMECADAAHGLGGFVIADGGCTCPGDVAKAFAGGADFVMLGGMLAGHDEGGGEIITKFYESNEVESTGEHFYDGSTAYQRKIEERNFVQFYGMSSKMANEKHFGGLKDYRASEGREILIPYRGQVSDTIQEILGGLRSTCTYVGASQIKHLTKCATFVKVGSQYNTIFA